LHLFAPEVVSTLLDESAIHAAVAKHLSVRGVPGLLWWHCPNGGLRLPTEAARLKGQGTLAGVSDICALYNSVFYALEIKRDAKAKVTPAQRRFIEAVKQQGGKAEIGRGLDDCLDILERWRLLRGTTI
jgi:hypothetical protein